MAEEDDRIQNTNYKPILTTKSIDPEKVFGFDGKASALERLLLKEQNKDHFKALALHGAKGIGKTTLCQVLLTSQEVKNFFTPRIWVCLNLKTSSFQDRDQAKVEIVTRMIESLGVNEAILESPSIKDDLGKLVYALSLMLRGKRYLVVLDGADEEGLDLDDWFLDLGFVPPRYKKWSDRLAYGLPKGHGGAVVVTTRSKEIAKKMVGKTNLYEVSPLSDPKSSWSIFKNSVREIAAKEKEMSEKEVKKLISKKEKLKRDVKQECAGVPMMAKLLGEVFYRHNKGKYLKFESKPSESEVREEEKCPDPSIAN